MERLQKKKICKIEKCKWVAKKFMKWRIKECRMQINELFLEMRNSAQRSINFSWNAKTKICKIFCKNWKNLLLTMLILTCTNYISQPEDNFFNMKSETIIVSDIKLFSKNDCSSTIHFFSPKQTSMSHNTINCPWYQKLKIAKSWNLE